MSGATDTLAIPGPIRAEVLERDGGCCRMCGVATNVIAHHVFYGGDQTGMGGRRFHAVDNIVTVGQGYEHKCHERAHANKMLWQPILSAVMNLPGVTGFAIYRWVAAGQDGERYGLDPLQVQRIRRA